ncbi:glycosyltransferase [Janibacter limosus]|uniref:glycosyltransferase n=1 Tax=Janibacter limosus TaxID=53458 RepID=UPI000832F75E|nr:glycosyltransferase [Janibacter limosus]
MSSTSRTLRICLIASSRFPVSEPFAGGLEAHTHALARELRRRGHAVTLFAKAGSDPDLDVHELPLAVYTPDETARKDVAAPPATWMDEHHAYLGLMLNLMKGGRQDFDLVHNNSLHHLPVAMSSALDIPVVTTLHTPPLPWLTSAVEFAGPNCHFVSVSKATALAWAHIVSSTAVPNGVDLEQWRPGPGGGPAVWSGRIVPEKAPHQAILAARRAAIPLRLAGEVLDRTYFEREVEPLLGDDVEYVGHLAHGELVELVREACVALVTPAWEEPFGLVAAEAMSCGTPVAAFARGALTELVTQDTGALATPGDVQGLADAMHLAAALDRRQVRRVAEMRFSHRAMVDGYESVYHDALETSGA